MNALLQSITGGYSKIKFLRFTILSFAIIDAAAHLYASPSSYPYVTFWLEIEVAAFIVIGIVFLLGLKIWYLPSVLFTAFNLMIYLLSGIVALPPISPTALSGHIQFSSYSLRSTFNFQVLSSFSKSFNLEPLSILIETEPTTIIYIHTLHSGWRLKLPRS